MRQIIITVIVGFISINLVAQNLTMAQLLELKKKDLGNAEEFLTAKGWEFSEATEPTLEKFGSVTFTYNKSEMSKRAESFLDYIYSDYSNITRIAIQVNKKIKYNEYINSIKGYGCKLINSKVEDGRIVKIYRGATTTFRVVSGTSENYFDEESAVWHIIILSNDDYETNFSLY